MALHGALIRLEDRLAKAAAQLELVIVSARRVPARDGHFLAGRLEDSAEDITGWLRGARRAVKSARRRATDSEAVRRNLAKCQECVERMVRAGRDELRGRRRIEHLRDLASRKPGAWAQWADESAKNVVAAQRACRAVERAMARAWRELAGQPPRGPFLVQHFSVAAVPRPGKRNRK